MSVSFGRLGAARLFKLFALNVKYREICSRNFSANDNLIVDLDAKTGIAIMKLNRRPANCFDTGFSSLISETLKNLESDPTCRALIMTSNIPGIFSGGLDFQELYKAKRAPFLNFIRTYQQLWLDIYSSPLATVAAINGSSPAGGCVIAIATDYRIMSTEKGTIGLNEVQVGLPIRTWLVEPYARLIGDRQAELAILRAKLFKPEEALAIGLIDETASNGEELMKKANDAAKLFLNVPDHSRRKSKLCCRKDVIDKAKCERDTMLEAFADSVMGDEMQSTLENYVQSLKAKNRKSTDN